MMGALSPALQQIVSQPCAPLSLVWALQGRMSIRASAVKARAAHSLSEASSWLVLSDALGLSFVATDQSMGWEAEIMAVSEGGGNEGWGYFRKEAVRVLPELVATLRRRVGPDERATVRKASIDALLTVLLVNDEAALSDVDNSASKEFKCTAVGVSKSDVVVLEQLCSESPVANREAVANAFPVLLDGYRLYSKGASKVIVGRCKSQLVDGRGGGGGEMRRSIAAFGEIERKVSGLRSFLLLYSNICTAECSRSNPLILDLGSIAADCLFIAHWQASGPTLMSQLLAPTLTKNSTIIPPSLAQKAPVSLGGDGNRLGGTQKRTPSEKEVAELWCDELESAARWERELSGEAEAWMANEVQLTRGEAKRLRRRLEEVKRRGRVFASKAEMEAGGKTAVRISVGLLEIYNKKVMELLEGEGA